MYFACYQRLFADPLNGPGGLAAKQRCTTGRGIGVLDNEKLFTEDVAE
jgi:hypothetical protein